jgi:hypothetical protein
MAENKMTNAQNVSINEVTIYPNDEQELLLKDQVIELCYFEDLYSFVVSGYVTLRESQGILERWQLSQLSKIKIDFGRVESAEENISAFFQIYTVEVEPTGTTKEQHLKLYFCSKEFLKSASKKIQRGAPKDGEEIYKTVSYIIKNYLGQDKPIEIEETKGIQNLNLDTKDPLAALSWLAARARPATQPLAGADMIFFENKYGFKFKSLRTLMAQEPYNTYKYQPANLTLDIEENTHNILQLKFVKAFNILDGISSGAFANRLISVDPQTRSYRVTDFDYNKYLAANKPMNDEGVLNYETNSLGYALSESPLSVVKVVVSNPEQNKVKYINDIAGAVTNDAHLENSIPNRTAEMTLANYTLIKIAVPGDPNLVAGCTVNVNIYSLVGEDEDRELDPFYSGKYLVNAVRHVLQPSNGMYQTFMELAKDSYSTKLESSGVK